MLREERLSRCVRASEKSSSFQDTHSILLISPAKLVNMTRHSKLRSIVCSMATFSTLLSPVTGFGFAFDTASFSPQAIAFLTVQFQGTVFTCVNGVIVLGQEQVSNDITDPIGFTMNELELIIDLRVVFIGEQVSNRNENRQVQQILGISNYTQVLLSSDLTDSTANNSADTASNLILILAIPRVFYIPFNKLIYLIAHIL